MGELAGLSHLLAQTLWACSEAPPQAGGPWFTSENKQHRTDSMGDGTHVQACSCHVS